MSHMVKERYRPYPMGANTSLQLTGDQIGGFIAITSGTITVVNAAGETVVNACPVTAGVYLPLPMLVADKMSSGTGLTGTHEPLVTLGGGASGTLLV